MENKNGSENLVKLFSQEKNILAFVTTKKAGDFRGNILAVQNLVESLGFSQSKVAMCDLIHDEKIFEAKKNNFSSLELIKGTDGATTKEKNIFLAITFADCLPIFFCHPKERMIGLLHVGWRGAAKGIVEKFLGKIEKDKLKSLKVALGPGIDWQNYEFNLKVAQDNFFSFPKRIKKSAKKGKCYLDLKGIVKDKLTENGVREDNITDSGIDTFSDDRFFSYRKSGLNLKNLEACVAVIGIVD